jgi:hypothetical protein
LKIFNFQEIPMADPAPPALPQPVVDALAKAQASKSAADAAATEAKSAVAALGAAQQANQTAIAAAASAAGQLTADRQALDAVNRFVFSGRPAGRINPKHEIRNPKQIQNPKKK